MRYRLLVLLFLFGSLCVYAQEKTALLIVHFGTSYDDTRAKTIDAINAEVIQAFPDYEVREAWSSRIIIRKLKAHGVEKFTPVEALIRLRADGFKHVIVQSTTLLDGAEMELLRRDIAGVENLFEEIRIGKPLLFSVDDCRKVADILVNRHQDAADAKKRSHVVFVGHGTYTPATATYSQMDYLFTEQAGPLFHVATIEGYPTFESMLGRLKVAKARSVTLVPMLVVAGDHANNDIAVDWKQALEAKGLQVECRLEGLGEIPEIRKIYIEHIRACL